MSFVLAAILVASGGQIDLVGPPGSGLFGASVTVLPNGNLVVTDPGYDGPGPAADVGAVYVYHGETLEVLSMLAGSTANDRVGFGGITVLSNGNFVVRSFRWNGSRGAATWGNAESGVNGVVSAANSLVGETANDLVGVLVTPLANGDYVVTSSSWDNGNVLDAGGVTWCNGLTGTVGEVTPANSLVGTKARDQVGIGGIRELLSGRFVVSSPYWDNGPLTDVGAVTWVNDATNLVGLVSAANSLIGSATGDQVGSHGITSLVNGNYVVRSGLWGGRRGAVTWANGAAGIQGLVSATNSLVGSTAIDLVGGLFGDVKALPNGHYVVLSQYWDNGPVRDAGAVTWGDGTIGTRGVVSPTNSLVGSKDGDYVGGGITVLSNSAYVVFSSAWDHGSVTNAGAITWASGVGRISGPVTPANSLVGSRPDDHLGYVTALANGNYVVSSPQWDNGSAADAGAVTWAHGNSGLTGMVMVSNSLVGSRSDDGVGFVHALPNGNYVVASPSWDDANAPDTGAVTWCDGSRGATGLVSSANSLVGSQAGDSVGDYGVTPLANGHYVISSGSWRNGSVARAGAVTWGHGTNGIRGLVSTTNSLVGTTEGDQISAGDYAGSIVALGNGDYVVVSPLWDDGAVMDVGAVTWVSGWGPTAGVISAENSLIGSSGDDRVGTSGGGDFSVSTVEPLPGGRYAVRSGYWHNEGMSTAGAVTLGEATPRARGKVRRRNSVLGDVVFGGGGMRMTFDGGKDRLIVVYPAGNRISLFSYPTPLVHRVNRRELNLGSARDGLNRFHHDYDLHGMSSSSEQAVYARGLGDFLPALQLVDAETLTVFGSVSGSSANRECLLLFTNLAGVSYQLNAGGAVSNATGVYDVARYSVVRPGMAISDGLTAADPFMTNRVAAVGAGRWYYDDFLLRGIATDERLVIEVEAASFSPFLETRLLSDEAVQDYRDGSSYTLTVQGTAQGPRDYLIRVTSSASGGLGEYSLRVNRFQATPEIWSFSPASGVPGTKVLVRGTNFLDGLNPVVTGVEFGGAVANWDEPVAAGAAHEFAATVPASAVSGPIRVLASGTAGTSTNAFVVLSPAGDAQRDPGGGFSFAVSNAVDAIQNVVERATTLTPPVAWTPVTTNLGMAGVWRYTNANPGAGPQQFFRVRRQ